MGASVWSLPVFLSGKIQQCFCSMPGNTFQETTKGLGGGDGGREREREQEREKTLISQQLKADKQGGECTEPCCDPQLQSSNRHLFLTPFASKEVAPIFI